MTEQATLTIDDWHEALAQCLDDVRLAYLEDDEEKKLINALVTGECLIKMTEHLDSEQVRFVLRSHHMADTLVAKYKRLYLNFMTSGLRSNKHDK